MTTTSQRPEAVEVEIEAVVNQDGELRTPKVSEEMVRFYKNGRDSSWLVETRLAVAYDAKQDCCRMSNDALHS